MRVNLLPLDLQLAGALGQIRLQTARQANLVEHARAESWELHVVGAKGEIAFRALTGLELTGNRIDASDFPGYELKTRTRPNADLIIKPHKFQDQPPSMVYVLAHTMFLANWVEFLGWITLGEFIEHPATRPFEDTDRAAFILDQKHLHPMKGLPCLVP